MAASERQAYLKYKKQLRLDLKKKYPERGAKFIKELQKITSFNFNKYKALGIKPVSNEVVKAKINNSKKTNKNIVNIKKNIEKTVSKDKKESPQPKAMPQSIKDMRAKNKKTGSKTSASASNTKDFEKTKRIQKRLKDLGADIKVDGIMGAKTRAAMAKDKAKPKKVSEMTTKEVMERGTYGLKSGGKGTYEQRQAEIRKEKSNAKMADKMLKTLKMKK
jgi:hypothetical protein